MSNSNNYEIRWQVKDPQNRIVVLKKSTYEKHIGEDHSPKDAMFRKEMEEQAKYTITSPGLIIERNLRHLYYKIVSISYGDDVKIKPMKVIVDADREPNEVVTWLAMTKMKDTAEAGEIIYERRTDDLSDK